MKLNCCNTERKDSEFKYQQIKKLDKQIITRRAGSLPEHTLSVFFPLRLYYSYHNHPHTVHFMSPSSTKRSGG